MKKSSIFLLCTMMLCMFASSCSDGLDIEPGYEFKVTNLPVPKRIAKGQTVEIRFEMEREGISDATRYYVRYFQPEGRGKLRYDGWTLIPNDSYEIRRPEAFKMFYTSECDEMQVVTFTFFDNFKHRYEIELSFANETDESVRTE